MLRGRRRCGCCSWAWATRELKGIVLLLLLLLVDAVDPTMWNVNIMLLLAMLLLVLCRVVILRLLLVMQLLGESLCTTQQ